MFVILGPLRSVEAFVIFDLLGFVEAFVILTLWYPLWPL